MPGLPGASFRRQLRRPGGPVPEERPGDQVRPAVHRPDLRRLLPLRGAQAPGRAPGAVRPGRPVAGVLLPVAAVAGRAHGLRPGLRPGRRGLRAADRLLRQPRAAQLAARRRFHRRPGGAVRDALRPAQRRGLRPADGFAAGLRPARQRDGADPQAGLVRHRQDPFRYPGLITAGAAPAAPRGALDDSPDAAVFRLFRPRPGGGRGTPDRPDVLRPVRPDPRSRPERQAHGQPGPGAGAGDLLERTDRSSGCRRQCPGAVLPAAVRGPGPGRPAAGRRLLPPVVRAMSGHVGLREDARQGHLLARRIARLFAAGRAPALRTCSRSRELEINGGGSGRGSGVYEL
ncbi:hypothetical protein PSEUDO8AS_10682 [Pseudomonas sp. 8AS]|nr:hypothetical protein PSEUDO8AS_10682 [Pseudomonas sp. 8AS]